MTGWRRHIAAWVLAAGMVLAACGDDDGDNVGATGRQAGEAGAAAAKEEKLPSKMVFAAVPSEENEAILEDYEPFVDAVSEEIGLPIEFITVSDYAGVIEAQIAGRVHLAQYGPFSYVLARQNGAKIEPVGAMVEERGGQPGYQSFGITKAGNGITSLKDFRGKKVCFVDPASTSGFLYPSAGLLAEGIDPKTGVTPVFAGGHDASAIAVAKGDCQAGFAFDSMVEKTLIEKGAIKQDDLEVVWKSEVIAGSPLALSTELPASLQEKIRSAVLEVNAEYLAEKGKCGSLKVETDLAGKQSCRFTDEGVFGYAAVEDSLYDGVRKVCQQTKSEKCVKA